MLPNKRRKCGRNKSSHASRSASQQKDKKLKDSSDVRLAQQCPVTASTYDVDVDVEQKPKKKSSAQGASQHTDKKREDSSDVQLAQMKPKKKSPAQMA